MTEYETATLAIQQSRLAVQQAGLEISRAGLGISRAGLWIAGAQVFVGLLQSALIAWGLNLMWRASKARDNQHQETKDRHEETMLALRALIERTAPRPASDG